MPTKKIPLVLWLALCALMIVAIMVGCDDPKVKPRTVSDPPANDPPPPICGAGTISEYATLATSTTVRVGGYGIVAGLGRSGSDTSGVPPQVISYLKEYLQKKGLGWASQGTRNVTPDMVLKDPDTAVVVVAGRVPAMAPVGTRYDLVVQALPQTQTTNLNGGFLMDIDMYLAPGGVLAPTGATQKLAEAGGQVFVNPFLDMNKPSDIPRFREGRILNGGVVTKNAPVQLVLRHPDFALSAAIQKRINERFHSRGAMVANSKNPQMIDLTIPREYRGDYIHFLNIVMHLPMGAGPGAVETKAPPGRAGHRGARR